MNKLILLTVIAFTLSGCFEEAAEKRRVAFMEKCAAASFSPEQCTFLLAIRRAADDAASDASAANAVAAVSSLTAAASAVQGVGRR